MLVPRQGRETIGDQIDVAATWFREHDPSRGGREIAVVQRERCCWIANERLNTLVWRYHAWQGHVALGKVDTSQASNEKDQQRGNGERSAWEMATERRSVLCLDLGDETDDILSSNAWWRRSLANVARLTEGRRNRCGTAKNRTTEEGWGRRDRGKRAEGLHRRDALLTTELTALEVPVDALQARLVQRAKDKVREKLSYGEVILDRCITHRLNPISGSYFRSKLA